MRLFCFPHAGGRSLAFRDWAQTLSGTAEVHTAELPGRGMRFGELPERQFANLLAPLEEAVRSLADRPFAFFGHSMGALIAFDVARELRRRQGPAPLHLFLSGARAPHLPSRRRRFCDAPDAEFIEELGRLRGTPPEVLEDPELLSLLLPVLRADFSIVETYAYREEAPLACALSVFGGRDDDLADEAALRPWARHTTGWFRLRMLPGDHFFPVTRRDSLLRSLAEDLFAASPTGAIEGGGRRQRAR